MGCGSSTQVDGGSGRGASAIPTKNAEKNKYDSSNHKPKVKKDVEEKKSKYDTPQSKDYAKYEKKLRKKFLAAVKLGGSTGRNVLIGCHDQEIQQNYKTVRIFTSSTFTDSKQERNALMVRSYPELKEFCQELGYNFQIVDMRWGIREDADDKHTTTDICLKEIQECQQVSTGPSFVTFLSHKYGYRPLPRVIPMEDFEKATQNITDEEREVMDKAFRKDENCIPVAYVLQPVSSIFPEVHSSDPDVVRSARTHWTTDIHAKAQNILIKGARQNDPNKVHHYEMSVTEREIRAGIYNVSNPEKSCNWFKRVFSDLDQAEVTKKLARYFECADQETDKIARDLMNKLENELPSKLPESNINTYNLSWEPKEGVNPDLEEHSNYITQLCTDFNDRMKTLILNGVNEEKAKKSSDPLQLEVTQHSALRQAKCKQFHGRESVLKLADSYLKSANINNPFILIGDSGCGKTSLMAKIATESWQWLSEKAVVIYRFVGTSQSSSSIRPLLDSINAQIMAVYAPSMTRQSSSMELKTLKEEFLLYLSCVPKERPLILMLDSLDQLDPADGGRQLDWLPKELPEGVRMILSTLPQDKYVTFPRCKAIFPENKWFVAVPELSPSEMEGILTKWLKNHNHTLTGYQRNTVTEALSNNPLPLFLKLSFDESCNWHSYDGVDLTVIKPTVIDMINSLFDQLEKSHGKLLVSYSLGYLTAAQVGLAEVEMEDLMSLNDEVLNDVYQYWTPPMRRLPPLLWVRIKNDLKEYIVSRGADGVQVIYWYHRQFIETAKTRYLSDETFVKKCHKYIAEYFMGTWADKAKPYTDKNGKSDSAKRMVTKQPLMYTKDKYNIRKLNQLPYHLIESGDLPLLKKEVLCNYEFLLAKLRALGLRSILGDLKAAQMAYPKDRDISIVLEALQLSSDALTHSPTELGGQLTGRIHGYGTETTAMVNQAKAMMSSGSIDDDAKAMMTVLMTQLEKLMTQMDKQNQVLNDLLTQVRNSTIPVLIPNAGFLMPPGGQLLHKLSGHLEKINDIDMTNDGAVLATGSDDKTLKFWNVYTGEIMKSVDVSTEIKFIKFFSNKKLAISCTMGHIMVINYVNGEVEAKMQTGASSEYVARPITVIKVKSTQEDCIVALRNKYVDIFEAKTGKLLAAFEDDLKQHKTKLWGEQKVITSCQHFIVYSAFADDDFYVVPVNDLKSVKVYKQNVFAEEAEWLNLESTDHISNMAVAEGESQVIVCNGKTKDLLFYDIETRHQLFVLKNNTESINHVHYSLKERSLYYTSDNEVGKVEIGNKDQSLVFRHPCKVSQVMSQDGRVVVTTAEDNILRVWDKVMEPFSPDLSGFTGKVHVRSNKATDYLKGMLGDMDIGEEVDVSSALTSTDTKNYWSKTGTKASKDKVYTTFHPFPNNPRYIAVAQSHHDEATIVMWTRCFTIWDLANMQCVRRSFLPEHSAQVLGSVYINGLVSDNTAVLQEYGLDIEFKLLNLHTWKVQDLTMHHTAKKIWGSQFKHLPGKNVFLLETSYDQLTVFDLSQYQSVGYLTIRKGTMDYHLQQIGLSFPYRTNAMTIHKYDDIKVCDDESRIVTCWGHSIVTVWDTKTWGVLHEMRVKDHFPEFNHKEHTLNLSAVTDDNRFIVVNSNVPAPQTQHNSTCVFNLIGGNVIDYTVKKGTVAELAQAKISSMVTTLQAIQEQEHYLQWIGVGKEGESFLMEQQPVGIHANKLMTSEENKHFVTWSTDPLDKTIRLFGIVDGIVEMVGAFTPDEEVYHIALIEEGNAVVINTPSGLIRLELKGKDIKEISDSNSENGPIDFNDIDLNVDIELTPP